MEEYQETSEKKCPICNRAVPSDASVKIFCALCGMGIPNPDTAFRYETIKGVIFYFCCDKCLAIYLENQS